MTKLDIILKKLGLSQKAIEQLDDIPTAFLEFFARRTTYLKRTGKELDILTDTNLIHTEYSIFVSNYKIMRNNYRLTQILLENCMGYEFIEHMTQIDNFDYKYYVQNGYDIDEVKTEMQDCCFALLENLFWIKNK